MRSPDHQREKIKRVLLYFQELQRLKIDAKTAHAFMCYVFHFNIERLWVIYREYDLKDLENVRVEHFDVDLAMIDAFARKINTIARRERVNQLKLDV